MADPWKNGAPKVIPCVPFGSLEREVEIWHRTKVENSKKQLNEARCRFIFRPLFGESSGSSWRLTSRAVNRGNDRFSLAEKVDRE